MFLLPETFRPTYISPVLFELLFLHPFQESPERPELLERKKRLQGGAMPAFYILAVPSAKGKVQAVS